MERMYYRKKDLVEILGVAKSTIADWVAEFHMYIPVEQNGAVTYYLPQAIEVLKVIKELREQGLSKPDILSMLSQQGFPVTVKEAEDDLKKAVARLDARRTLVDVMQGMQQAMQQLADNKEAVKRVEARQESIGIRQDEQDERIFSLEERLTSAQQDIRTEQDGHISALKEELNVVKQELATALEELKKNRKKGGWWPFGRK